MVPNLFAGQYVSQPYSAFFFGSYCNLFISIWASNFQVLLFPNSFSHHTSSVLSAFPKKILFAQFEIIVSLYFISGAFASNWDKFWAVIVVATLYFLYNVNIASVSLHIKSGNSSIYKKCGILLFSFPGLLNTAFCIDNKKNNPNALWLTLPKSPLRVHTNVTSPFANALSKSILLCLLHNIVFTPGNLNKLSSCDTAKYRYCSVIALPGAFS